jgi:hypothetical protein
VISLGTLTQSGGGKEYLPQYPERQIEYVSPTDREKEAPGHRDGRTLYKLTSSESSDLGSLLRCRPNTCGWCLTSSGKNEFSKTKLAPKQTFPMMAHKLPSRYAFGVIGRKSMVATAPTAANVSSMVFRNWPWSAAPDIVTTTSAWRRTLMLNVYMAKLAVLISIPSKRKTHCPLVCGKGSCDFWNVDFGLARPGGITCEDGTGRSSSKIFEGDWDESTKTADYEDLCGKGISVEARQFFPRCRPCVLAMIGGRRCVVLVWYTCETHGGSSR